MKKTIRILALLLALSLLLGTVCSAAQGKTERDPGELPGDEKPGDEKPGDEKPAFVYPDDWSHDAMVFVAENGIMTGDEHNQLNPKDNMTRAQMAAVLVRLLAATKPGNLTAFKDALPSAWYYSELSTAHAIGVFSGVSDTSMQPNAPITREQTAVVLCRAFGILSEERTTYQKFTDGQKVMSYSRDAVSAMVALDVVRGYEDNSFRPGGYITRAEVAQMIYNLFDALVDDPAELPAEGCVLYRGKDALPQELTFNGTLILGQAMPAAFAPASWSITGDLVVRTGENTDADLRNVTAKHLVCAAGGGKVTGKSSSVWLWGSGSSYYGDSESLTVMDGEHTAYGAYTSVLMRDGSLILEGSAKTAKLGNTAHLTANGTVDTIDVAGKNVTVDGTGRAGKITVNNEGSKITLKYDTLDDVWYRTYQKEHDAALQTVKTQRVPCKVEKATVLYKNVGSGYIRDLPVGTIVYNEFHPAGSWFYVSCSDGVRGWVPRWDCYIPDDPPGATDGKLDYSKATKEGFADLKGYESDTNYLVWISRYTQKVIVYTGSKGDWTVLTTLPCSSGMNNCPTPEGIHKISVHDGGWNFDNYYVKNVTIFNGDIAFHSILFNYGGSVFDGELGYPKSHGCIRMTLEDSAWMQTLPIGTTVVVY